MKISLSTIFNAAACIFNLIVYYHSSKPSELNMFCAGVSLGVTIWCLRDDFSNS